jgi:hypothetical protein
MFKILIFVLILTSFIPEIKAANVSYSLTIQNSNIYDGPVYMGVGMV